MSPQKLQKVVYFKGVFEGVDRDIQVLLEILRRDIKLHTDIVSNACGRPPAKKDKLVEKTKYLFRKAKDKGLEAKIKDYKLIKNGTSLLFIVNLQSDDTSLMLI